LGPKGSEKKAERRQRQPKEVPDRKGGGVRGDRGGRGKRSAKKRKKCLDNRVGIQTQEEGLRGELGRKVTNTLKGKGVKRQGRTMKWGRWVALSLELAVEARSAADGPGALFFGISPTGGVHRVRIGDQWGKEGLVLKQ